MPVNTFDISITTLVYGGEALGRLPEGSLRPGLAVFVPGALPGERVRLRLKRGDDGRLSLELEHAA